MRSVWNLLVLLLLSRPAGARPLAPVSAGPPDTVATRLRRQLAAHPQPDSMHLVLLTNLADALQAHNVPAARPARVAALALARHFPRHDLVAETLLDLADYHIDLAQYDSATTCLLQSDREFARLHDLGGQIRCLGRLGRISGQQGQYAASLAYNFAALRLPLRSDTRLFLTSIHIQLGTTYAQVGEYGPARAYLTEAQCTAEHYNYPDRLNLALGQLGEVSRQQHQWAAAQVYYTQSIAVSRRLDDLPTELAMQLNLARLDESQGDYGLATRRGQRVLAQLQAAHLGLVVPLAEALLARLALRTGQVGAAIAYATSSLRASQRLRLPTGVREATAVLAEAYTQRRDYRPAYQALRQYQAVHDSLTGQDVRRRSALLQFGQQQRTQQARIRLLTQQNRLQAQAQELAALRTQRQLIGLGALLLLGLLLAGTILWQYRRRQAAREAALRTQIAADLHDDVGTLLSQISLQSSFLQQDLSDAPSQRRQLSQIAEASRSAVRQLNDVVWSLDAHNDTLPQLVDRLRDYAYEVLVPTGLHVHFEAPEELPAQPLPIALRRHFYLIYKEALHNILKHAHGATQATVRLSLAHGPARLLLDVADDAPPAPVPAGITPRRSGHGLRSIGARAAALGGAATCGPLAPGGFRVRLWVPLG